MKENVKKTSTTKKVAKNAPRQTITMEEINYKNVDILKKFLGPRHSILRQKLNRVNTKMQRRIAEEIKKARQMALLKYTDRH